MAENDSPNFKMILNQLHYNIDKRLLEELVPEVARTKFGPQMIE